MRKDWLWIGLASVLLAACSADEQQTAAPPQQVYNGPVVDIPGVEPKYEPINPSTNQDYRVNGKQYKIIKNPDNYSETGLATWYGNEASGNRTATGETFDPDAFTAAHPTLPLPGYVRVTNLANGRQLVVRINDRGPYTPGRIIDLSEAAANRLNISNQTPVRVDYIKVAPDGTLSGPGTVGTRVVKQSFALPARPDIGMTTMGGDTDSASQPAATAQPSAQSDAQPVAQPVNPPAPQSEENAVAPASAGGFIGAPQPLRAGVLEGSEPAPSPVTTPTPASAPVAAPAPVAASAGNGHYVVQVGALSDQARAQQWLQSLSKRFGVRGMVSNQGHVYRVQLGHFSTRQQAAALQKRLLQEANQQSFVTVANTGS